MHYSHPYGTFHVCYRVALGCRLAARPIEQLAIIMAHWPFIRWVIVNFQLLLLSNQLAGDAFMHHADPTGLIHSRRIDMMHQCGAGKIYPPLHWCIMTTNVHEALRYHTILNTLTASLEKCNLGFNHQPYAMAMCSLCRCCPRAADWVHGCCPEWKAKQCKFSIGVKFHTLLMRKHKCLYRNIVISIQNYLLFVK